MNMKRVAGATVVSGTGAGEVLHADVGLSFWGGVDPESGIVIDEHHPLRGQSMIFRDSSRVASLS